MNATILPLAKRISPVLIAALGLVAHSAHAQLSIGDAGVSYVINFDTGVTGVNNGAWAGTGFDPGATVLGRLDSNAWAVTGWSDGNLAFGGTQTTAGKDYTRGIATAAVTTGGMYAFSGGNITTGVALGIQPGGSDWNPGSITLRFRNDTASLITGFNLDYKIWVRNDQPTRASTLNFSRSSDDVSYTPELALDYTSGLAADALGFTLVTRSISIAGLSLAANAFYYLRWSGADVAGGGGSRDEFALDDITLSSFSTGVAGRNLIWSPITGVWDTAELNWNETSAPGVPVAFQSNDGVTFDDAGLALQSTVTIAAAGVTVGNTKVTNTTGAYTFTGGSISGSGNLTKSGAGKLVLSSPNAYSGGTIVSEGTLSVSADNQLGAASGGLLLSSGSVFETTGSITLGAGRALTGSGTLNIAPSTALNVAGSAATGVLTLSNTGSLMFTSVASPQIGGFNIQQAITLGSTAPIILGGSIVTTQPSGTVAIQAPLSLGTALRVFNIGDGTASVDASITGNITSSSAGGRIHKLGDGTLELLGDNSAMLGGIRFGTAGATPVNGGTIIIGSATSLGPGGAGTSGQFQFNAGTLTATAPIQFPATLSLSIGGSGALPTTFAGSDVEFLGTASLFLSGAAPHNIVADSNVRFASVLTGSTADLKIAGLGSLTLAAGMTVTGDVSVEGGKFFTSGNIAGALPIDNRPTITANLGGTVGGSQTNQDSFGQLIATGVGGNPGTISPGLPLAPVGSISATSLSVLPDGVVAIQIGGLSSYDIINVNGAISLSGSLTLSLLNGYVPSFGDTFGIILNDDVDPVGGDGAFAGKAEGSSIFVGGTEFQISYVAGDGNDIFVTAVPEPGSAALLLGGLALIGFSRRRRD